MLKRISAAVVAGVVVLAACKKSDNSGNDTTTKMYGTWTVSSILEQRLNASTGGYDTVNYVSSSPVAGLGQITFENNGTAQYRVLTKDTTVAYHAISAQLFVAGADTLHILTLTNSAFQFYGLNGNLKTTTSLSK